MKKALVILSLFLLILTPLMAQDEPDLPPEDGTGEQLGTPLDGGLISLIIATSVGYLFYNQTRKKEKK
jgi:hypothetical protein